MCTVSYLPVGSHNFILTSNRDEQPARSPKQLSLQDIDQQQLCFPQDTTAGGTWIAISNANRVVCLLNGAFEKHHHEPPYRRSRGLMVLDLFRYQSVKQFFAEYEFQGMEPFTMIIIDEGQLYELRWDEYQTYPTHLDRGKPFIWASATLYDATARQKRQWWFEEWKKQHPQYSPDAILDFHRTAGDGDPWNDVVMDRDGIVKTVSVTQIIKSSGQLKMDYHDLLNGQTKHQDLPLRNKMVDCE